MVINPGDTRLLRFSSSSTSRLFQKATRLSTSYSTCLARTRFWASSRSRRSCGVGRREAASSLCRVLRKEMKTNSSVVGNKFKRGREDVEDLLIFLGYISARQEASKVRIRALTRKKGRVKSYVAIVAASILTASVNWGKWMTNLTVLRSCRIASSTISERLSSNRRWICTYERNPQTSTRLSINLIERFIDPIASCSIT